MPAADKATEMLRQWEMLRLLPDGPPGTKVVTLQKDLADLGYPVDPRTIQRNLEKLEDPFGLHSEKGLRSDGYSWYWPNAARDTLRGLSTAEAVSLRLVEQTVKDSLPVSLLRMLQGRFEQARQKLDGIGGANSRARWLDKVSSIPRNLTLVPPEFSEEVLDTVQEGLLEEKELEIKYKSLQDKTPSDRLVHPRALLQKGPVTYLIANKVDEPTPRMFAIHRISEAYRTGRPVSRSPFNLKSYLAEQAHEVGTGEWLDLDLWVSANLAKILRETPLAKGQTLTEVDDGARVQARIKDTLPLRQWIRGHGPAVEVLGPVSLRQTMAADLRAAADRYSKPVRRKRS